VKNGITFPLGFLAQGVEANIKKQTLDLAVIFSEVPCQTAGVFTTNRVQAACVKANRELIGRKTRAIVINSGNANACTGLQGEKDNRQMMTLAAECLGIKPEEVLVASTGVIGVELPMDKVESGINKACASLSKEGGENAAAAIMTTDTFPKTAIAEFTIGGKTVRMGGMAKGSGMIHPDMATTLIFITTDAVISKECLQQALQDSANISYNMISVDGDTSTNDMALILANCQAGNVEITAVNSPEYQIFREALDRINISLAKSIARDGEGATCLIEVEVSGARQDQDARQVARTVVSSSLFKAAVFGKDANWGRIICAVGYSGIDIDPDIVDICLGRQQVARKGAGVDFDEEMAKQDLSEEEVKVQINLNQGEGRAVAWGCDLTYDYVKINAAYRT